jgi:hypothetical protein
MEISLPINAFLIYAHLFNNITRAQNVNLVYLEAAWSDALCELYGFAISQAEYRRMDRATVSAQAVPFPNLRSETSIPSYFRQFRSPT